MRRALLLLMVVLASPAWAQKPGPVPLGATGLSPTVYLWKQTAPGESWTSQSTVGISVAELSNGSYSVSGLPDALGTIRYYVLVEATSNLGYGATYGAVPGTSVVWKHDFTAPAAPLVWKAGDSQPSLQLVVNTGLPAGISSATATLTLWNETTRSAVVDSQSATITDVELDSTTNTYGATFTYAWGASDLATAGTYRAEFEITYSDSSIQTVPPDNSLRVRVLESLN